MNRKYNVIFTGKLLHGYTADDVSSGLTTLFSMDPQKAETLIATGKRIVLKRGLDNSQCQRYKEHLQKIGMEIELEDGEKISEPQPPKDIEPEKPNYTTAVQNENPYAAPKAGLEKKAKVQGGWSNIPAKVAPGQGWKWVTSAVSMFFQSPLKWSGAAILVLIILIPLSIIPVIGSLINMFLMSLLGAGLILTANQQSENGEFQFDTIFKGFTHINRNQLLMIAVFQLIISIIFFAIMFLVAGTSFMSLSGFGDSDPEAFAMAMQGEMLKGFLIMLIIIALSIPLMAAYWFSIPLVTLCNLSAWQALKTSFQACLKNWLTFIIYGLAFLVIGVVISLAIGALIGLGSLFFGENAIILAAFLPFLTALILGIPLTVISGLSLFTGFKNIFYIAQ